MAAKSTKKAVVTLDYSHMKRGFKEYISMWLWVGWISFYFLLTVSLPLLYLYAKIPLTIILGLILISLLAPIDRKLQPKWAYSFGRWLMEGAAGYFHLKVVCEDPEAIKTCGVAIFALEPHDVLPLSIFGFNDFFQGVQGHTMLGCLTSACFSIPLMKHIYTWVNAHSIDKKSIQKMIAKKISPVLCPGGVQEVLLMENEDECVLFLNSRFGFIKLAIQNGTAIVPVFSFGLRKMFTFIAPKSKLMKSIGRKLGFLPMLFFGMWGMPFGPAKPCDIVNLVGSPIKVPHIADPSDEVIREHHAVFVAAMVKLYEENKEEFGMGHVKLRIA